MSDQLEATVLDAVGRTAKARVRVDDEGKVVVTPPPPGPFTLDPGSQLENFREILRIAGEVGRKKRGRIR